MDMTNVYEAVRQLQHKLEAAEVHRQSVVFNIWGDGYTAIRLEMKYGILPEYDGKYETFRRSLTHGELSKLLTESATMWDTLDTWFTEARAWVDAIPTADERAHKAFTAQLGRLIDQGREIGIEVDFLNPLTAMMEKLASNALEDKRNK